MEQGIKETMVKHKKAAVFILLGQSNAVGHGVPMLEKDIIRIPLKNVFGLSRDDNQSFHNDSLKWSNYTSYGMNLAEEQDNTYSIANCLAIDWQNHIDNGNECDLPDLYIVQIAIGAQGVTEKYMWYPNREEVLIPGKLGKVNISLFPFSNHIFSLLDESFKEMNKEYEIIGLHWRGGESDLEINSEYLKENLLGIYSQLIGTYNELLHFPPIILHKIVCYDRMKERDETGMMFKNLEYTNFLFDNFAKEYVNVTVFDPCDLPQYISEIRGNGLFKGDMIHFTAEVNKEISTCILSDYIMKSKPKGE